MLAGLQTGCYMMFKCIYLSIIHTLNEQAGKGGRFDMSQKGSCQCPDPVSNFLFSNF